MALDPLRVMVSVDLRLPFLTFPIRLGMDPERSGHAGDVAAGTGEWVGRV